MPMKRYIAIGVITAAGIAIALGFFACPKRQYIHSFTDLFFYSLFLGEDTTEFAQGYKRQPFKRSSRG